MDLTVCELFAGVGGFRCGLEASTKDWKTVWANQWEPSTKNQFAFDCYQRNFGVSENHVNQDISTIDKKMIPDHTLLVGGFPCQDYSVAATGAKGLEGKKGVLWWQIEEIVKVKRPPFILLENVDRLLKSPTSQRGRDFAIMLYSLNKLGYIVEWRVINAADYGGAQKRKRVFIFAYGTKTKYGSKNIKKSKQELLFHSGFFADIFPVLDDANEKKKVTVNFTPYKNLLEVSNKFNIGAVNGINKSPFWNSGVMIKGEIFSTETLPKKEDFISLREVLESGEIEQRYFLGHNIEKWEYLKGAKTIRRIKPNGEPYNYTEGKMAFPDNSDAPGRTMLTSESSVNRSTHVVEDIKSGKLRLITPIEAERLNGFPDDWTKGMTTRQRYFCMGNALVVGIVEKIGNKIKNIQY
ncbi:MAG: DNA (cytosine-5-)-methyltransferase [Culicoidibacterales bacterium]